MIRIFSFLVMMLCLALPQVAQAEVNINVTQGSMEPLPVAVASFDVGPGVDAGLARQMPMVVRNNLESSGLFKAVPSQAFIQDDVSLYQNGPRFGDWRAINAQALITGAISQASGGKLKVEFYLWDIFGEKQLAGMVYSTTPQNWRRIAHIVSDEIYKRITGEDGYFDTRIVYIAESGPADARKKRLAVMDQDGFNHHYLTDGKDLVLTPRFSPNQQMITYLAYYNNKPRVYLYNIDTGRQQLLGDFPGMTFAPRFSPDSNEVIMSQSRNGNSDIFVMNLKTKKVRQLTSHLAIDTSPCFSPDGEQVVFESDRGGSQQLYVMDKNGNNVRRITFGNGRYGSPVWSPRGDLIAFTRMYKGQFYIGVIRPDGSGERLITNAYHVEGPTWSPNGRVLAYFKETRGANKRSHLYSIDLTGYNERMLSTPGDGSDPAWSPINP